MVNSLKSLLLLGLRGQSRLLLLGSKLLLLLGKLLLLRSKLSLLRNKLLLLWLESRVLRSKCLLQMSRQRINLAILVVISRETCESNILSCQFSQRFRCNRLRSELWSKLLLRSKLLLLLGSKLLLRGKLLLLLGSELLLRRKLLLLLGSKLLLLLRSELLLLGSELLLLLRGKLLLLLLTLLSKLEILVECLPVKLLGNWSLRIEFCCIEYGTPLVRLVGKVLSLDSPNILLLNSLLFFNHTFLVCQYSSMSGFLLLECRVFFKNCCDLFGC